MKKPTLAAALAVIGRESAELESKATTVLRIVRQQRITDGKSWNAAVRAAYKANGWNGKPGKPKAAERKEAVPATVKQYVSAVRSAFRLKLPVSSYTSFYALRQDLLKHRAKARKKAVNGAANQPEFAGLHIAKPEQLTGAPFHDLMALYGALERKQQNQMLSALDRVKRQFAPAAPQLVVASLPDMGLRKAA